MKIILGSENIPKRDAVIESFSRAYPDTSIEVECVRTESGVADHPTAADEAMLGAKNRAASAMKQKPGADFYVGIEGGLLQADGKAWEIGWIAIYDSNCQVATGLSAGVEIKGRILQAIQNGQELNDVLDDVYGIGKIGNANGFYGLVTDDLVTRQQAYVHGIIFAIGQYKHPELY